MGPERLLAMGIEILDRPNQVSIGQTAISCSGRSRIINSRREIGEHGQRIAGAVGNDGIETPAFHQPPGSTIEGQVPSAGEGKYMAEVKV